MRLTTPAPSINNIPVEIFSGGGFEMRGTVRCARRGCGRERTGRICPYCGYPTCYISVYWKGKHWMFYAGQTGKALIDFNEANAVLSAMRLEINAGRFEPREWVGAQIRERKFRRKIFEWLQEKMDAAEAQEFSFETLKNYKGYANNFFLPFFGDRDVKDIKDDMLEEFKASLRTVKGIKTRKNILNALHAFFVWMRRRKVIAAIPQWPEGIKGDNAKKRTAVDIHTQEEALRLIPREHRDVVSFLTMTGLRSGELCALKVKDLREDFATLLVQRTWSGPRLKETTKTEEKVYIPLSRKALTLAIRNARGKHPEAWLFINPDTGNCYRAKKINGLIKATGVGLVAHEFGRHSFITQLVQTPDVTLVDAQALARHRDVQSTLKYSHTNITRLRDITERRGQVMKMPVQNGFKTKKGSNEQG